MNPARAVRDARRRAGISQVELARRTGLPPKTVSRIERAAVCPRMDTLIRVLGEYLPGTD